MLSQKRVCFIVVGKLVPKTIKNTKYSIAETTNAVIHASR